MKYIDINRKFTETVSNYIAHITVSWKIVLINCFLLTVAGDFVLCVLSAIAAQRLTIIMRKILH